MEKIEISKKIYDELRSLLLEASEYMVKRKFGRRHKNFKNTDKPFEHFIEHQTAGPFLRYFVKAVEKRLDDLGNESNIFMNIFEDMNLDENSYPDTDANELESRVNNLEKILKKMRDEYEVGDTKIYYDAKAKCLRHKDTEIWFNLARNKQQARILNYLWEKKDEKVSFDDIQKAFTNLSVKRGVFNALLSLERSIVTKSDGKISGLIDYSEKDRTVILNKKYFE